MSTSIRIVESAWMSSNVQFEEFMAKFDKQWFFELGQTEIAPALRVLSDEQKKMLKSLAPGQYEAYMKMIGGDDNASSSILQPELQPTNSPPASNL